MKKIIYILYILLSGFNTYSQKSKNLKIVEIEGYFIQGYIYDTTSSFYNRDICTFSTNANQSFSILFGNNAIVLADCYSKVLSNKISQELSKDIPNFWLYYYQIIQDTSKHYERNMIFSDCFYQDEKGKVFLVYKLKARSIILRKLCKKYQNNWLHHAQFAIE